MKNETTTREYEEKRKQYQFNRAKEYVKNNISKDGSEPKLEWCIIKDLVKMIETEQEKNKGLEWEIETMQELNIENSMNSTYNLAKLQRQNRELTDMLKDCYDKLLDKDNYVDDMKFNFFMCKLSNLINESEEM
ncbi:MAG: hypothetical protein FH761_17765 [Firmicutes bacterium]|nr:hypothetical protein [Bacillota bacterium]